MAGLKMDGTTRKKRAPKRATKLLPFFTELAFVDGYKQGKGERPVQRDLEKYPAAWAGFQAGKAGMDHKQAFVALQEFAAAHGFHRD